MILKYAGHNFSICGSDGSEKFQGIEAQHLVIRLLGISLLTNYQDPCEW
jgi:hypothetical protein